MKKKWLIAGLAAVIMIAAITYMNAPERRVLRYYNANKEDLNQRVEDYMNGENLSWSGGALKMVNAWPGEHEMVEYILISNGNTYRGFYYSPDDVPLAFQNTETILYQEDGSNRWTWSSEGDNHGETYKIDDGWYYFSASF